MASPRSSSTSRDPLARWLVQRFGGGRQPVDAGQLKLLEGYVSIVINTVLAALKIGVGWLTGSIALLADAVHTLADSITSVVVVISAYVGRRPADREHPFGHGRSDPVAALIVAVLLGVAAFEFLKSSALRVIEPQPLDVPLWAAAAIAATALAKLWLTRFASFIARLSASSAVEADAWHHATDVLATLLVVVAMLGGRYGLDRADGVIGVLVSVIIGWTAWRIAREAMSPLLGEAPSAEELAEIALQARAIDGVIGVHDIVVHKYGERRVVSLHVETSEQMTACDLHNLAEEVQDRIAGDDHGTVVVHVDPVNVDHPHYRKVQAHLAEGVAAYPELGAFHDLRLVGDAERFTVLVDVTVQTELSAARRRGIEAQLHEAICQEFPRARLQISFDPAFAYTTRGDN